MGTTGEQGGDALAHLPAGYFCVRSLVWTAPEGASTGLVSFEAKLVNLEGMNPTGGVLGIDALSAPVVRSEESGGGGSGRGAVQGYNKDDPLAERHVGRSTRSVDSVAYSWIVCVFRSDGSYVQVGDGSCLSSDRLTLKQNSEVERTRPEEGVIATPWHWQSW